jgi:hypothetical protein
MLTLMYDRVFYKQILVEKTVYVFLHLAMESNQGRVV